MSIQAFSADHSNPTDAAIDAVGEGIAPLPYRGGKGASILGPQNLARQQQGVDLTCPPSTDQGDVGNYKWSFSDSHTRIEEGGWTRQTTIRELPTSVEVAGVNMRLDKGAIRELHWHKEAEWAYILAGKCRITALDTEGGNFIGDVEKGDLWYFPAGFPHSLQGIAEEGTEFLLIFDDGRFSEESTFLLTEWLAHTPSSVLAKNFKIAPEIFDKIPEKEKYIFSGSVPTPTASIDQTSGGTVLRSNFWFTHQMLSQPAIKTPGGGEVRITDSSNFPISKTIAAAHVIIPAGGMREMHWHPNADEWSYFIRGRARMTIFAGTGLARTFNYMAGDVGVVPRTMGHYVENLSETEEVEMLEIFRAPKFEDFSLRQWLGDTPERMVGDTLFQHDQKLGHKFFEQLSGEKEVLRAGKQ